MARILLADDAPEILEAYEIILTTAGHEIFAAHTGNEAKEILRHQEVDVILTDLLMPDGDGIQLAISARKLENPPKLVVVTGGGHRLTSNDALKVCDGFFDAQLRKPAMGKELLAVVDSVLTSTH